MKQLLKRLSAALVCMLLLHTAAAAASAAYVMTVQDGFICVRDARSGQWVHETRIRSDSLSPHDRLLLETGIELYNQADFTTALEDFCS